MRICKFLGLCVMTLVLWVFSAIAAAQVPDVMSFQGFLTDANSTPLTGTYSVGFSIYASQSGGSQLWTETQSVNASAGAFSVLLGSVDSIPAGVFTGGSVRYLGIRVGSDPEMTPRQRIGSVGYAYVAENVGPGVVNIDPNGNVGIGTKSPGIISGANRYLTVSTTLGDRAALELRGYNNTDGGAVGRIDFIQGFRTVPPSNTNLARIEARKDFGGGGKLVFCTDNGTTLKTRMSIDSGAHVTIVADESPVALVKPTPTLLVLGDSTEDPFRVMTVEDEGGLIVKSDGSVGIGTTRPTTELEVIGVTRTDELQITGGADIAEPFDIRDAEAIRPGMVVVIDPQNPGGLKICEGAYDRCVAGIVSGAGGLRPGLTMMQQNLLDGAHPVALSGRVYAFCDASHGPIEPGDLLTTSSTAGHAMKVTDYGKAHGAIIGKAMTPLREGKGLVLVLVSLQ